MKQIDREILIILSRVTITDNKIYLTCGQLDRKQYVAVNSILELMGGKWNRKAKAHIFNDDPIDLLETVLETGEIQEPKKYGYFPTPEILAKHIVDLADIKDGHLVLEPSAGQGAIIDYIPKYATVEAVELLQENVEILCKKHNIKFFCSDFLSMEPNPIYDRIVMNPPFERQQDISHVLHAWEFLKTDGRLVSIMSAGVAFRQNKKTIDFRNLIDDCGSIENNDPGAFKSSGTMVNTITVVLDKLR